ncbi:hypothetical protein UJ101_02188 [Flavobacteriaceae bacterium UJ101]|nr:hypothetical protein UJ101_02188 [Flavobacteriaceae bacterium UJ101]
MKSWFTIFFILILNILFSQSEYTFRLPEKTKKEHLSFKLINNQIIISTNLEGTQNLNFIIDTGSPYNIVFNYNLDRPLPVLNYHQKISIKGPGDNAPIEAFILQDKKISLKKYNLEKGKVIVVNTPFYNFEEHFGTKIHGILGYDFFKYYPIKINFQKKFLTILSPKKFKSKNYKSYTPFDITIENNKAYLQEDLLNNQNSKKLLIDTGNSDTFWLNLKDDISLPSKHIEDFLGFGINGNIYGYRARFNQLQLKDFTVEQPIIAFPKQNLTNKRISLIEDIDGSIGSGFLNRFHVIFDYPNRTLFLKKNSFYSRPYHYNLSGITIKQLHFSIPIFEIHTVRKESNAYKSGIREGDIILKINNEKTHDKTLHEVFKLLPKKEYKKVKLLVNRNGRYIEYTFRLHDII